MSGHSKWKTIKHKKAAEDAKKSKAYTKIIKEITVAARTGGGDPNHNPTLRTLLDKAKAINMPQENATRAIKKGTGELPGIHYEHHQYEGYGPGGMAIIIDVLTDNKNRAVADIRSLFTRKGGSLAEAGAVSWMFERAGIVRGTSAKLTEDRLLEALIDFDIISIEQDGDHWTITCNPHDLEKIKKAAHDYGLEISEAEVEMVAKNKHEVPKSQEPMAYEFLDAIDDLDDVQNVYTNIA
ncbi:MAG: YebC/PmpR family DNA-binding transcriptional regulator [Candidatus Babeliaceae bacterium]|nr:YebC/PmpR family DNA-binding transcriptional regulator [Candidatus Babeliaceae bacterium]